MIRFYEYECIEHGIFEKLTRGESGVFTTKCPQCYEQCERILGTPKLMNSFLMNGSNRRLMNYSKPYKKGLSTS